MGWKGTARSLGAAYRAAERESNRRHRELQRLEKEYSKMQILEQAAYEVDCYENHLERLISLHKEGGTSVNWLEIKDQPEPSKPLPSFILQKEAAAIEAAYTPTFIARIFGQEKRKRAELAQKTKDAISEDDVNNKKALKKWEQSHAEWLTDIALAERVLNGDLLAKQEVIKELNPFAEIADLGSSLNFRIHETGLIECDISTHGNKVIPTEIKSLLSSGKLSVKKMPVSKFNELFQDYICSCALRVANEIFNIIPGDMVIVTVLDDVLNTATGHLENLPILSVAIPRATIAKFNMQAIDPSDAMSNFVHNMSFKKTSGFLSVSQINPADLKGVAI